MIVFHFDKNIIKGYLLFFVGSCCYQVGHCSGVQVAGSVRTPLPWYWCPVLISQG